MFSLNKLKNWTRSSVTDDKKELNIYQLFQEQITSMENKISEYIKENSYEDSRLFISYNGEMLPLTFLESLKQSAMYDETIDVQERAKKIAYINRLYLEELKKIEEKIIQMALSEPDNTYLNYINSCLIIINKMLIDYNYLLAIQKSDIKQIASPNAYEKLRHLRDSIEIRIAEIQTRLSLEEIHRR